MVSSDFIDRKCDKCGNWSESKFSFFTERFWVCKPCRAGAFFSQKVDQSYYPVFKIHKMIYFHEKLHLLSKLRVNLLAKTLLELTEKI